MIFENKTGEEFKFYGDRYIVSNYGRIYSFKSFIFISFSINPYGYYHTQIQINGIYRTVLQHRIIAINFIPNPENKKQINHIDGIKTYNHLIEQTKETLKYCTLNVNERINWRCEDAIVGNYNNRKDLKECERIVNDSHITIHN